MPKDDEAGPPRIPAPRPPSDAEQAPLNAVAPANVAAPSDATLLPADVTVAPADVTLAPADVALTPGDFIVAPADATFVPADLASAPVDAALPSADIASAPADDALAPADVASAPADDVLASADAGPVDASSALTASAPPGSLAETGPPSWLPDVTAGLPGPYALAAGPSALGLSEPAVGAGGRTAALRIVLCGVVAIAVLASIGLFFQGGGGRGRSVGAAAAAGSAAAPSSEHHYAPVVETPFEAAVRELQLHGAALVDGDEAGWMAVVDPGKPALVAQYRGLFGALRALGVTRFSYTPGISVTDKKDPTAFTFPARVDYCFGADTCAGGDPAAIRISLTMKNLGGRYVITAVRDHPDPGNLEPVPWQDGKLQVVQGQRVVVGADASEAPYLAKVLPIAEKAAAADEPFAGMLLARQSRYRVFLAGEEQWRRWYGGKNDKWVIGYAVPISQYGYDVVLRVRSIESPTELRVTLQHEFGHVITLTGSATYHDRDEWLREGVAEYIGWSPKHATDSYRRDSVEGAIARKRPSSMIPAEPPSNASARAGNAYYGLSHFAVDCLAQKYGQPNMFRFVRLVLLRDESYEDAARDAFKQPFAKVDKACATWIRQKA